jgi:AmmeMemoRadiSam system protein B
MATRKASFAGSWYPADLRECEREIRAFIAESGVQPEEKKEYCGAILPHAGWFFSGRIACESLYLMASGVHVPDVVVIFGVHMRPEHRPAILIEGEWETPLGKLPVNASLGRRLIRRFPQMDASLQGLPPDNTIELQLPFIKYFWPQTTILPIGAPPHPDAIDIGTALAVLAEEEGLVLRAVGSTDLTHYGPNYGYAPVGGGEEAVRWAREENDRRIIDAMLAMDPARVIEEALDRHNACCPGAAAAAIACGKAMGARSATRGFLWIQP